MTTTTLLGSSSVGSGYAPSELVLKPAGGQRVMVSSKAAVEATIGPGARLSFWDISNICEIVEGSTGKAIFGISPGWKR